MPSLNQQDFILPRAFEVSFANMTEISPMLTKGRVRIFYPLDNRNNVNIEPEVAEQLASTLPYTPVVGIYVAEEGDFKDHAETKTLIKKAYGMVPEFPNMSWEDVTEKDGSVNTYLTADVYLWTKRYPEVSKVIEDGKSQSMELDPDLLEGTWGYKNGKRLFNITKAYFSALCILGEGVEPCFESASFYTTNELQVEFSLMMRQIKEELALLDNTNEGGNVMGELNFKMYNEDIQYKLFDKLNPADESGFRSFVNVVISTTPDYAVVLNFTDEKYYRVAYSITETDVEVQWEDKVQVTFVDLTVEEEQALEGAKAELQAQYAQAQAELEEKVAAFEAIEAEKIELEAKISEFAGAEDQVAALTAEKDAIAGEIADLKTKLAVYIRKEKEDMVHSFTELLPKEDIDAMAAKVDEFTLDEIESKLSVMVVRKKDFTKVNVPNQIAPPLKEGWKSLVIETK